MRLHADGRRPPDLRQATMKTLDEPALLESWAASAGRMDEFVLVSDLLEESAARGADDLAVERARAAVVAGRPALAAGLLADVDRSVLDRPVESWRDAVAVAAWAAEGDGDALAALIRVGQGLEGSPAALHGYLLAAAAEQAGEDALADDAWRSVDRWTQATMAVRRRLAVADVLRRSTADMEAAGVAIARSARSVIDMSPRPEDGLWPVEDVVSRLEARGDADGAWLFLETVAAVRPSAEGVARLRDERAAGGGWWLEHAPGLVASVAAAVLGVVAGLVELPAWIPLLGAVAAFAVWARWRLPQGAGLSETDARVLAMVRALLPDGANAHPDRVRRIGAGVTGAAVAFVLAVLVTAGVVDGLMPQAYEAHAHAFDAVTWPVILWLTTLGGLAGGRLMLRWTSRRPARRMLAAERAESLGDPTACQCLTAAGMRSVEAEAYVAEHLHDAAPDVAAAAPTIRGADLAVHECPVSHTPWLSVQLPGREALLLRGVLARVPDPPAEPGVGGYL